MSDESTATVDSDTVTISNLVPDQEFTAGGTFQFDVSGQLTIGEEDGDPLHGFRPPETYACGWPKSEAPQYAGDYALTAGQPLPDGVFFDTCDDQLRLHESFDRRTAAQRGLAGLDGTA